MLTIGLVGFIGSGKSTVAKTLINNHNFVQDSFARSLKDTVCSMFGWDRKLIEGDTEESRIWREKVDPWWSERLNITNFTPRMALQMIGTDVVRNHFNQSLWFITLENRLRQLSSNVVVSDIRFSNEMDFVKSKGGIIVKVSRGKNPIWYNTAILANDGNANAALIMKTKFSNVHSSEWEWCRKSYDFELFNDSTIENLEIQINNLIDDFMK